jgi:Family of unknown function (DUF6152)
VHIQKSFLAAAVTIMSVAAQSVLAHHSYAMFDQQTNVTIEGTVKEVKWTNPHIWIQVLVKDVSSDAEVEWSIEGGSPNILTRGGWTRNALKAGDKVEVVIHPIRNGNPYIGSLAHLVANGQRHFDGPDQGLVGAGQ